MKHIKVTESFYLNFKHIQLNSMDNLMNFKFTFCCIIESYIYSVIKNLMLLFLTLNVMTKSFINF